jgi:hypothetical protein
LEARHPRGKLRRMNLNGGALEADLATPLYLLIWLPSTPTNKRSPPRRPAT